MKMSWFEYVWDSMEELEDFVADNRKRRHFARDWTGDVSSWADMDELNRKGWVDGVRRAQAMQVNLADYIQTLGLDGLEPVEEYDVGGAYVDVGLYCDGEPECMVEWEEKIMPNSRIIRIAVQINFLSDVGAAGAMRRGVAIAAMVDALEMAGLQVELWAVDCTRSPSGALSKRGADGADRNLHRTAVRVKEAGEPVALDRVALAIGHPAYFRVMHFEARQRIKGTEGGNTASVPEHVAEAGELIVPPMNRDAEMEHFSNDEKACEWACEQFSALIDSALERVA